MNCEILSLEQVKEKLVENQILECQNSLRNYVACHNAMAGLDILQGDIEGAAACYKETLAQCKKYNELNQIHTDLVQLIHCNFNLLCCEEMRPGLLEPSFLQEVRESLRQEEEEFLEKPRKNLEKAIANCFSNDLPQNLIEDSFRFMQSVTTELNDGIAVDVESRLHSYGDENVLSVFQFVDRLQDSNPKNKSIIAFKKSLRVVPFHSLHNSRTFISAFTARDSSCKAFQAVFSFCFDGKTFSLRFVLRFCKSLLRLTRLLLFLLFILLSLFMFRFRSARAVLAAFRSKAQKRDPNSAISDRTLRYVLIVSSKSGFNSTIR